MRPILYQDIFNSQVTPLIGNSLEIEEWNNLSRDIVLTGVGSSNDLANSRDKAGSTGSNGVIESPPIDADGVRDMNSAEASRLAHTSILACERACRGTSICKQYAFRRGECRFGNTIRLGMRATPELAGLQSRWIPERVEALRREAERECSSWNEQEVFNIRN